MQLADYRGRHRGEPVLVCGCGASLTEMPPPAGLCTIGVNDVGRWFQPTYLVVVNGRQQFRNGRFHYVETSTAQAIFTQLDLGVPHPNLVRFKLGKRGGTDFSDPTVLHYTRNSPYVALCLAIHLGAERIALIGVDFTEHHFFARTGRHPLARDLTAINEEYRRLGEACQRMGISVVNLSRQSRLTAFPKMKRCRFIPGSGDERSSHSRATLPAQPAQPVPNPRLGAGRPKVVVQRHAPGLVGQLLDTLALTAQRLGCSVSRSRCALPQEPSALSVVWNGRAHRSAGRTVYCEHGWLPRSHYQVSPSGINANSHIAPFLWRGTPLTPEQDAMVESQLDRIRKDQIATDRKEWACTPDLDSDLLPDRFFLVPLQVETDTNLVRHAPPHLRRMQALIDHITSFGPPHPVIFKQHPADHSRGHDSQLQLKPRRRQDLLWAHNRANVHQLLKTGQCAGIFTVNSNVAHDALLWDVPVAVLGHNVWPRSGDRPFATGIPKDFNSFADQVRDPERIAARRAYAHYLITHQWTLIDAADPEKVEPLLASFRHAAAFEPPRNVSTTIPADHPIPSGDLRLHYGCGKRRLSGFLNLDARPTEATDLVCEAWQEGLFPRHGVAEIYSRHMLEHLEPADAERTLKVWRDYLKPGGTVRIIVPDLQFHARQLLGMATSRFPDQCEHALHSIYGWKHPERGGATWDAHRWGYTEASLRALLLTTGFEAVRRVRNGVDSEPWHLHVIASSPIRQPALPHNRKDPRCSAAQHA